MKASGLALTAILALTGGGCAFLQGIVQPPTVALDRARFVAADWDSLRVDLHVAVHNPNTVGVKIDGYGMTVAVDGLTLLDGDIDEPLDLRGGATADLILPAHIRWAELGERVLGRTSVPSKLPYSIQGRLRFTTPIGPLEVPFEDRGEIPVLRPPSVLPVGLRVEEASLASVRVALDLDISSEGGEAMSLTAFTHDVAINGDSLIRGRFDAPVQVARGEAVRRTVSVDISMRQVAGALASALLGGGDVDVALTCEANIDTGYGELPWSYQGGKRLSLTR